ncbi:MAG TPA: D-aminoacyl-tRNA deacylase [Clostridiales bacterium]|nr:D-aminoacyl-tRNA deacylase [Clostridiales bacterium]HQP70208.1 D-aminoacyl-tRNA deacylase [Clostridiales bacterium]
MKILIQRTDEVKIVIGGKLHSCSGKGLLLFIGIRTGDSAEMIPYFIEKIINLRIFEDSAGKMNMSVKDIGGEIAAVSQFTLYADTSRGRRPGFSESAPPEMSEPLYNEFIVQLKKTGLKIAEGVFGAHMEISLINNGPATFILER